MLTPGHPLLENRENRGTPGSGCVRAKSQLRYNSPAVIRATLYNRDGVVKGHVECL